MTRPAGWRPSAIARRLVGNFTQACGEFRSGCRCRGRPLLHSTGGREPSEGMRRGMDLAHPARDLDDQNLERKLISQEEMTMARSRTPRETVTSAADASKPARTESDGATADDIARRAFDLYLARGRQDG